MSKKIYYIRCNSTIVRKYNSRRNFNDDDMPVKLSVPVCGLILKLMCRKKQRLLSQAWNLWTKNCNVFHDYTIDLRIILCKDRGESDQLDEYEVEVIHKWCMQRASLDPTGLAAIILKCRKRTAILQAFQNLRLEQFEPGEVIIFQGTLPKPEDGLFTIISGSCDVVQYPPESLALLNLGVNFRKRDWDACKNTVNDARLINTMRAPSGFGEMASLALIMRTATVRAAPNQRILTELAVIPRKCLFNLLSASIEQESSSMPTSSEAIDFLRQSGLGMSVSSRELFTVANCMQKKTISLGNVLYFKNQPASKMYFIVSGEIIADIQYNPGGNPEEYPYLSSLPTNCFILSNGSMLGEEAFIGNDERLYLSTVSALSDSVVFFEVAGDGLSFFKEKLNCSRYSALAYKDQSPWGLPIPQAESNSIYTMFNSLRKCISEGNPYRGAIKTVPEVGDAKDLKLSELGLPVKKHSSMQRSREFPIEDSIISSPWDKIKSPNADTGNKTKFSSDKKEKNRFDSDMDDDYPSAISTGASKYPNLPATVIQHTLKMKRDLMREESHRIRAAAKDGILHDELKKRGERSSHSDLMHEKWSNASRQLKYNIGAYNSRSKEVKVSIAFI
jgi:CRP-like cAMP-binding protein